MLLVVLLCGYVVLLGSFLDMFVLFVRVVWGLGGVWVLGWVEGYEILCFVVWGVGVRDSLGKS